ncbi:hypothetical protein [Microbulbifer sp. ALW1]|uniref:hypothetical protein n=1 Tax=Microbulbifer sp. (strain ALW1) TaxID=1516059 RepID=UPI00135BA2F6|nr:hypothetical protein [Microbulbifer sp. ALW1]
MKQAIALLTLLIAASGTYAVDLIEGRFESFSPLGNGLYPITTLSLSDGNYTLQMKNGFICEGKWKSHKYCKPPYSYPVTGKYTVSGNKVIFDSTYMEENTYFLVGIRKWQVLLSQSEYEVFRIGQRVPKKFLRRTNP